MKTTQKTIFDVLFLAAFAHALLVLRSYVGPLFGIEELSYNWHIAAMPILAIMGLGRAFTSIFFLCVLIRTQNWLWLVLTLSPLLASALNSDIYPATVFLLPLYYLLVYRKYLKGSGTLNDRKVWHRVFLIIPLLLLLYYFYSATSGIPTEENELTQNTTSIDTLKKDDQRDIISALPLKNSTWIRYENRADDFLYRFNYPPDWEILSVRDNQTRVALGQKKNIGTNGYDGEMFVFVFDEDEVSNVIGGNVASVDSISKNMGKQFSDRIEKREEITINGIPALQTVVTTPSTPDWQYVSVIIEQDGKIYWIHNGAIQNELFKEFYESIRLLSE